ncbi:uncharacterized protein LOC112566849 isoform X2 [Pomacea canaliculata]|uniref:uncharacterized protein LOC112566849 isoform X2 n=1 Tax=Pomacea canaliculata TaxID=400727 RepID=UPI000D72A353|nr:uncharacterized protein LOC112566849 isoform X2 [Pomacea canaliculata]
MTTSRKGQPSPDPMAAVRYTPAAVEDDVDDACSEHNRLSFLSGPPLNGDIVHSSFTPTTTPSATANSPYPYYDFQDTDDNESEGAGCEVSDPCSPASLQHGGSCGVGLGVGVSVGGGGNNSLEKRPSRHSSSGSRHGHARYSERSDSRDLSKSPMSRASRTRGGKGRCMCCMMCVFLLSTAGLAAVLALTYAGEMQLTSVSTHHTANNGGVKTDRLEDEKVMVQSCETRECMEAAAAILGRMNFSASPCSNFYDYSCGGYNEKTYLSWFSTRVRESPEEIIEHYRKYAIDRLSSSYDSQDSTYLSKARTLFRSCLFRPTVVDEQTRAIVAEVIDALGGLSAPERDGVSNFDITPLVANVTRLYGASPFFRVVVHGPNKISIVSRFSEYRNPLQSSNTVLSRSVDSQPGQETKSSRRSLEQLLLSLLARTNYTGLSVPGVVQDFPSSGIQY